MSSLLLYYNSGLIYTPNGNFYLPFSSLLAISLCPIPNAPKLLTWLWNYYQIPINSTWPDLVVSFWSFLNQSWIFCVEFFSIFFDFYSSKCHCNPFTTFDHQSIWCNYICIDIKHIITPTTTITRAHYTPLTPLSSLLSTTILSSTTFHPAYKNIINMISCGPIQTQCNTFMPSPPHISTYLVNDNYNSTSSYLNPHPLHNSIHNQYHHPSLLHFHQYIQITRSTNILKRRHKNSYLLFCNIFSLPIPI